MEKLCTKCQTPKLVSEFFRSTGTVDGYAYWCKECQAKRQRAVRDRRRAAGLPAFSTLAAQRLRLEVLSHYSDGKLECACCKDVHIEFLGIDHVDGGGTEHRRRVGSNQEVYRELRRNNYPPGFRVLCHNCNLAIGFYGYCPHEAEHEAEELVCGVVGPFSAEDFVGCED